MDEHWESSTTTTHQDHVIAHVLGASVLGYFAHDETLHLLLDIGFIWSFYLDGQMVLLPHPVAVAELEVEETIKLQIGIEVDGLLARRHTAEFQQFIPILADAEIVEVGMYERDRDRRIVLSGSTTITIESSELSRDFQVKVETTQVNGDL